MVNICTGFLGDFSTLTLARGKLDIHLIINISSIWSATWDSFFYLK